MMGWSMVTSSPSIRATWARRGGAPNGRMRTGRGGGDSRCAATAADGSLADQYRTLRVRPGASKKEVKKAFRKLVLQYHPDVCKESHCIVQFRRINEAYDIVISSLRQAEEEEEQEHWSEDDLWEEWMGWEGAGTGNYNSHINPYL